jgi:MFS family permease
VQFLFSRIASGLQSAIVAAQSASAACPIGRTLSMTLTLAPNSGAPKSGAPESGAPPHAGTRLLASSPFRRAWAAGALCQTMRWLEVLVVAVFVFQLTSSAFHVAVTLFLRMLPSFLFGAFAGALAERFDRRRLAASTLACLAGVSALLGLTVATGRIEVWHVGAGVLLNGVFWSMDHAVRRTMLSDLAGPGGAGRAIALDSSTANATRMAGPLLGGVLLDTVGMAGAYFLGALLFAASSALLASVPYRQHFAPRTNSLLAAIREGLSYVGSNRVILGTLAVTVMINFWAVPYAGMVPVIAKDGLGLSAMQTGILMAVDGLGALSAALLIAWRVQPRNYTRLYFWGSVLLLTAVLIFTQVGSYPAALAVLLFAGIGFAGFGAMQSTIILAAADPAYRARAMGVIAVCIGGGAPLGTLHVGLLADWLGPAGAVAVSAAEGLVGLAVASRLWPELLRPFPSRF